MRRVVDPLVKRLLYYSGYYHPSLRHRRGPQARRLLILMYHDLLVDRSDPLSSQSPTGDEFAAHLREISRHYRLLSLRQAVRELQSEEGLREDSVAITFDDGYPSVYTVAFPLLQRYDAPATVYLLTGWINQEMAYWWQTLRDMIGRAAFDGVSAQRLIDTAGFSLASVRDGMTETARFRATLADELQSGLMDTPDAERARVLEALHGLLLPGVAYATKPVPALSWEQIRLMAENGIEFEAHTRTHANLAYANRAEAERDILESKQEIETRLQREVLGFAYPYGKDVESYRAYEPFLASHGFSHAVIAITGCNSNGSNPLALRRASLPQSTSRAIVGRYLAVLFASR